MMEKLKFRTLRADEIDCRINTVSEKGVTLLLYKDARVDQNILDEAVGSLGWQRHHTRENANCIVAIWDEEKKQWIEKEDTGTESNTEKEKGLASDSFKRACFNWGIGRELYTAPFIWINCKVTEAGEDQRTKKKKYVCYDKFSVKTIGYDKDNNINKLVIVDSKSRKTVYQLGDKEKPEEDHDEVSTVPVVAEAHVNTLFLEMARTGIGLKGILKNYKISDIHEMSIVQFREAMDVLKKKPDKPVDPSTIPPEDAGDGLPWNTPVR